MYFMTNRLAVKTYRTVVTSVGLSVTVPNRPVAFPVGKFTRLSLGKLVTDRPGSETDKL